MMKWFEEVNRTRPAVICSRVRLVRNLEQYAFPSRLDGGLYTHRSHGYVASFGWVRVGMPFRPSCIVLYLLHQRIFHAPSS